MITTYTYEVSSPTDVCTCNWSNGFDANHAAQLYITGSRVGTTYITITISTTTTAVKTIYFKTGVSDGTTNFSLDSETQLYDMRGYHYFIANADATTTFADLNIQ